MKKIILILIILTSSIIDLSAQTDFERSDIQITTDQETGKVFVTYRSFYNNVACNRRFHISSVQYKIAGASSFSTLTHLNKATGISDPNNTAISTTQRTIREYQPAAEIFVNNVEIKVSGEWRTTSGTGTCNRIDVHSYTYFVNNSPLDGVTNLQATNDNCGSVDLSWDFGNNVSNYSTKRVQYWRVAEGAALSGNVVGNNISSTSTKDFGATPGTTHSYYMRTFLLYPGIAEVSIPGPFGPFITQIGIPERYAIGPIVRVDGIRVGAPDAPTDIFLNQADCNGAIDINWTWSASRSPTDFYIERSSTASFATIDHTLIASGTDRSIRDNTTNSSQLYYYRVSARTGCPDDVNNPLYSLPTPVKSIIGLGVPPSTTVTTISIDTVAKAVTLNWIDNTQIEEGFKVVRTSAAGITAEFDVLENTTSYVDATPDICTNYTYSVKTYNSCRSAGVISTNSLPAVIPGNVQATFDANVNKLLSSDGEFGDRIDLKWRTQNNQNDNWNIYRINPLIPDTTPIASPDGNTRVYSDLTANANTLYNYLIEGESDCAGTTLISNSTEDVGFRLAFGTVNGQITYAGGVAVEGVKISAEAASGASGQSGSFDGTASFADAGNATQLQTNNLSFSAFINPDDLIGRKTIASKITANSGWKLYLDDASLKLQVGSQTYTANDTSILANNWFSVAATVSNDLVKLFVNGIPALQTTTNQTALNTSTNLLVGKTGATDFFKGKIDEVRLYNKALTNVEIQRSYDVYINPSATGLITYLRFDEGFGNTAFDYSKTLQTTNKNHATLTNVVFSNTKPSINQLSAGAYTDANGSYFIPFIPYLGVGDNFTITPSLGTHDFSPSNTTLYISGAAPNFSGIDFIDNSSFRVTGSVKFKSTSCFEKEVLVRIDGDVVIQNGSPVMTDVNGQYDIQVPIGPHVITVTKTGHVFSEGRFPATGAWDFQQNENLNSFIDSTLITVVGKVAGGGEQAALFSGMGKGKNNIGRAKIRLVSQQGGGCLDTIISTDPVTGEYSVQLPPMNFEIPDFRIDSNLSILFNNNTLLSLSNNPPAQIEIDTVFETISGIRRIVQIDTVQYNVIRDFVYYNAPSLNVLDENFGQLYGTDTITISEGDSNLNIPASSLGLRYPIFEENEPYKWNISAFEVYENKDGLTSVFDSVPLSEGKFVINNQLSAEESVEFNITPNDEFDGIQNYEFQAGQANTSQDATVPAYSFSKTFELSLVTPNVATVVWQPNSGDGTPSPLFRGVVFGGRALGNSFATAGPDVVTMILRDPPGTNSFAAWEANVTNTNTFSMENSGGLGLELNKKVLLGTEFTVGLGYSTKTDIENSLNSETKVEVSVGGSGEFIEEYSTTVGIQTGDGDEAVGANADLFFGRSMNMDFGLAQIITLIDTANCGSGPNVCFGSVLTHNGRGFKIGSTNSMFAVPGGYGTEFVFTQAGIENSVIPKLQNLRDALLSNHSNYVSQLSSSHQDYGKSNDDPTFGNAATPDPLRNSLADSLGSSYYFTGYTKVDTTVLFDLTTFRNVTSYSGIDSVWWYNRQIQLWVDALARNERAKVLASGADLSRNISYQGGTILNYSVESSRSEENAIVTSFNLSEELKLEIGAKIGGTGVEIEQAISMSFTNETSTGSTSLSSNTLTYEINDDGGDDEFTVDVFNARDGFGPIFKTRAGTTSCPYQGEEVTNYFQPGTVINAATVQIEQPRITASPSTLFNVPADGSGIITLSLINDGLSDNTYDLTVLEPTNPNGAILRIDGLSPNREFTVPAQTSISKLITIEKGPLAIAYDSIALVFHSQCQYAFGTGGFDDIADTVYLSVNFLPSCTDVSVSSPANQFVLNNDFQNQLPILVDGYDINYGGLTKIGLQYKPTAQSSWIPLPEEWFKDTTGVGSLFPPHPSPQVIPTNQSFITHILNTEQLIDQGYQLRAVTTCEIPGNPDAETYSEIIGGIADRVNPHPFGTPSPADGVLDPNDDISIQFNETIESGSLTIDNFQVTGVVNGQELRHDVAVAFDGATGFMEIANGFDFATNDFTVEFWAKRATLGGTQTVISQGANANNTFAIQFNASNNVEVTVGNHNYASTFAILDDSTWHHYAISYEKDSLNLSITDRTTSTTRTSTSNNFFSSFQAQGKTFVGKNAVGGADYFNGSIHELRIWNRPLSNATVASRINNSLNGREPGLVGYWPMTEARGTLAADKARFRNAQVAATWELSPKSSAASFDGIDDYAILDSAGTLAATNEMDLSIEFWFRTAGGSAMTFFSNGSGQFVTNDINSNGWSIELDAANTIRVKNNATDFEAVTANFADNNWHHFALVVNRLANTTAFIDGVQQNTVSSSVFNGFGSPKLVVGARFSQNGVVETIDQHFTGNMDEVRIWNSARLRDNIELDMFNRLKGDEFGLLAYYPFEMYVLQLGVPTLTPSFNDGSLNGLHMVAQNGTVTNDIESPSVALQRPVKNVAYTWSVNNDRIVISTNEAAANIENVTLNVAVKNVKDLHGNVMQSPKTWIAFVNKNQVIWQDAEKNLNKELNDTMTFSVNVVNSGGELKNYSITNLPVWLSVSSTSGSISPLSTESILFTVNPGTNIGSYSEDILLATDFGFNEKLLVNLNVSKTAPAFNFNPNLYQNSMSVIGQIRINGNVSANADDKLVALINGEVRGVADLQYVPVYDQYLAFLDVYSNTADSIDFQVWNATKGELHIGVQPRLAFVANSLIGTPTAPQYFDAEDKVAKDIALSAGWNWVSFPLESNEMRSFHSFFSQLNFSEGDAIKTIGNNSNALYSPLTGWTGDLTGQGIETEKSYLIRISQADTFNLSGFAIDPDTMPIPVVTGWNRIGFVSLKNLSLQTALANFNAETGDLIKSQQQFAYYDQNLGWIGSLQTLESTKGYLLKTTGTNSSFVYPRSGLLRLKSLASVVPFEETLPEGYSLNSSDYEASTSAFITINTCEELLANEDFGLAAFHKNQLRGWVSKSEKVSDEIGYQYYVTAFGNAQEKFTFVLMNTKTNEVYDLEGELAYLKNSITGSPTKPLVLSTIVTVDCDQFKPKVQEVATTTTNTYPNPFDNELTVAVPVEMEGDITVTLLDELGRVLYQEQTKGRKVLEWNAKQLTGLTPGVYHIQFEAVEQLKTEKIIKL